jgi:energy-coupling factor transporter ATP-binding protein EcfA2
MGETSEVPRRSALLGFGIADAGIARDVFVPARVGAVTVLCGPNDSGKSTILRAIADSTGASGTGAIAYWECKSLDDRLLERLLADPDGGLRRRDEAWLDTVYAALDGSLERPDFDFSRSQRSFGGILEQAWRHEKLAAAGKLGSFTADLGLAAIPNTIDHTELEREIERITSEERALFVRLLIAASWARNVLLVAANARAESALHLIMNDGEEYAQALVDDLRRFFELDGVEDWHAVLSERLDPAITPPTLRLLLSGNSILASQLVPLDELDAAAETLADEDKERAPEEGSSWMDEFAKRNPLGGPSPYLTIVGPALDEETIKTQVATELTAVARAMSNHQQSAWVEVISDYPLAQVVLPDVAEAAHGIGVVASRLAATVCTLPDGDTPTVTIRIRGDGDLRLFVAWGGGDDVPIADVAEGLRQWLLLALALASVIAHRVTHDGISLRDERAVTWIADQPDDLSNVLLILDEPERHLHPTLQRKAARFVESLAFVHGATVVLATHAPTFLRIRDVKILEVVRSARDRCETRTINRQAIELDLNLAARLGFDRGVIADVANAFLLVEGEHDETLLIAWFGEQLEAAGVRIVPFRGTQQLGSSVWALEKLVATSGLPVAVLLDATPDAERIRRIVDISGDPRRPPEIEDLGDRMAYERNRAVCDVLRQLRPRARLFVHDQPDIIFFLDETEFPARKGLTYTHAEARRQLDRSAKQRTSTEGGKFDAKRLLAKHFEIAESFFGTHSLQRAALHGQAPTGTLLNGAIDEITAWADSRTATLADVVSPDVPNPSSSQE